MRPLFRLCAALCLCAIAAAGHATPLRYDEAVAGDLPDRGARRLDLDIGVNTVRGTMGSRATTVADLTFETDPFVFTIPAGTALTAAAVGVAVTGTDNVAALDWEWLLVDLDALAILDSSCLGLVARVNCDVAAPDGGSLFDGTPYLQRAYAVVYQAAVETIDGVAASADFDYLLSITVAPTGVVAEPATALLVAGALGAVLALTRRRRAGIASAVGPSASMRTVPGSPASRDGRSPTGPADQSAIVFSGLGCRRSVAYFSSAATR